MKGYFLVTFRKICLPTFKTSKRNAQAERSVIDLARTSTDPDDGANFFEHESGRRETGVTSGTHGTEMRIAKSAWFRFATAAKGATFRFRVHGGTHAD